MLNFVLVYNLISCIAAYMRADCVLQLILTLNIAPALGCNSQPALKA